MGLDLDYKDEQEALIIKDEYLISPHTHSG